MGLSQDLDTFPILLCTQKSKAFLLQEFQGVELYDEWPKVALAPFMLTPGGSLLVQFSTFFRLQHFSCLLHSDYPGAELSQD